MQAGQSEGEDAERLLELLDQLKVEHLKDLCTALTAAGQHEIVELLH